MEQSAAKQQSTKPEQESTTAAAAPVNYMAYAQQYAQYAQQYRTTDPATADYYLQCYNYYVALAQTTSDPSIPAPAFPGAQIDPYSMGAVSMDQANMGYEGDEAMQKYTVAGSSKKKSDQSTEKLDEILRLHKKPQDGPGGKVKTVVRAAGGEVWHDPTLAEWDPNDFRLFVGDLGKDVSDDMLSSAFRKYPSFIRAKVVRDKRTSKTKGYGFVSFKDAVDYSRAFREMDGKYIGSRPVKLRKSQWKERNITVTQVKKIKKEGGLFNMMISKDQNPQ